MMNTMSQKNEWFDTMAFVRRHKVETVFLVAGMLLGIFFDWTVIETAFFLIFLWSILGPIRSRFLAVPALFFLVLVPVFLLLDREARAEELAVYAYYFLVMAVIRGIVEVRSEER